METNNITVFVTDDVARKFVLFQKYYEPFSILIDRKVFDQKNCAITLHFDANGILQNIQRADVLFSRRHEN